mgnify:CR=1 FL=1
MTAELLGTAELAALMGCKPKTVSAYLARGVVLPEPIARLACGPIWKLSDVKAWLATRRVAAPTEASVTAKLEALDSFVERHAEVVYRALRATEPTPTRDGKDHRPRRVMDESAKGRGGSYAIGTGRYVDPPTVVCPRPSACPYSCVMTPWMSIWPPGTEFVGPSDQVQPE